MATDRVEENIPTGVIYYDKLVVRNELDIRGTLTAKKIAITDNMSTANDAVSRFGKMVVSGDVSCPEVVISQFATTTPTVSINIDPYGSALSPQWDLTTVTITSIASQGTVTAVNPSTGVISYDPGPTFVAGIDMIVYTIVDSYGTTRTIFLHITIPAP